MDSFCLFAYTGLTDRFRRARGFLYNWTVFSSSSGQKKTCWFWKKFIW